MVWGLAVQENELAYLALQSDLCEIEGHASNDDVLFGSGMTKSVP